MRKRQIETAGMTFGDKDTPTRQALADDVAGQDLTMRETVIWNVE
jgi:hypothetical protein